MAASENHSKVDFQTQLLFSPKICSERYAHLVKSSESPISYEYGPVAASVLNAFPAQRNMGVVRLFLYVVGTILRNMGINSECIACTEEHGCCRIISACYRHNPEEHGPVAASIQRRGTRVLPDHFCIEVPKIPFLDKGPENTISEVLVLRKPPLLLPDFFKGGGLSYHSDPRRRWNFFDLLEAKPFRNALFW